MIEEPTVLTVDIDLRKILYNKDENPRNIGIEKEAENNKEEMSIETLAENIREHGLLSPITVQIFSDQQATEFEYKIIAGHRRYKAYEMLAQIEHKYSKIPAIIREIKNEEDRIYLNLSENLSRLDMKREEKAKEIYKLYMTLQQNGQRKNAGYGTLAKKLGISRGYVQQLINDAKSDFESKSESSKPEKKVETKEEIDINKAKEILATITSSIDAMKVDIEECDIDTKIKIKSEAKRLCADMQRVISFIRGIEKNIAKDTKVTAKEKAKTKADEIKKIMGIGIVNDENLNGDIF